MFLLGLEEVTDFLTLNVAEFVMLGSSQNGSVPVTQTTETADLDEEEGMHKQQGLLNICIANI